jgi:hypothetical protein
VQTRLAARRCAGWTATDQLALGLYGGAGSGRKLAQAFSPGRTRSPLPAERDATSWRVAMWERAPESVCVWAWASEKLVQQAGMRWLMAERWAERRAREAQSGSARE